MKSTYRFLSGIRHSLLAALATFLFFPANGQVSFFNKYNSPQPVSGGQVCNAGLTPDQSAYYFTCKELLLETDLAGHVRWGRELKYNNLAIIIASLEERAAGGFYGGGYALDQALPGYINFIFRLDTAGNTIWAKEIQLGYQYAQIMRVAPTADGGLGICAISSVINGQSGAWVGKTDSLGNLLWGKNIRHGINATRGTSIAPTRDGGFIVASKINMMSSGDLHTGLSRLDANGNLLWTQSISGAGSNDWPYAIQCADGGFAVAGSGSAYGSEGFRLCRTDSLGNLLWSTSYFNLPDFCYAQKVHETADHGFALTGVFMDMINFYPYPFMIRTDSIGDPRWARKLFYINSCGASSWDVQETPDGGFLLPVADLALIKTDPDGDIACVSFPVNITAVDTLVAQTSSLDFVNGSAMVAATITNTLLPITDSTICTGKFSPTGILVNEPENAIAVFPNPSEGLFTLQIENGNAPYTVAVYNSIGQLVRSYKNTSPQLVIDLTTADAGIYVVRITGEAGHYGRTAKLMKR